MSFRIPHRQRLTLPAAFIAIVTCLLLLVPTLDSAAQTIRSNPTPTPTPEFNPGLVTRSTETPTEPPERVSPTETPVPDDVPATGSIAISIGACDDSTFDPTTATGLDAFLEACQSPDGEFVFTVSDGAAFSQVAWTSLGTVTFDVPATTIAMVETIPAGWSDPAVFCWSNLLPTPSAAPFVGNGPTWDVQPGEAVECWWFNISIPPTQLHTMRVSAFVCPAEIDLGADYETLATGCIDGAMADVAFQLVTETETRDGTTDASGSIEWTGVNLGASGSAQIDEAVPGGLGQPVVWCVSFPEAAADPEDFDTFAVEATDGLVSVQPERHDPFIFECRYFHQPTTGGAGEFTDPSAQEDGEDEGSSDNTLILYKFRCPLSAPYDDFGSDIFDYCTDPQADMDFMLTGGGIVDNQTTTFEGLIEWTGLPAGTYTINESLIEGYEDVIVYCEWLEAPVDAIVPTGRIAVPVVNGQFGIEFSATGIRVECGIFNLPRNQSRILINKRICPSGVDLALTDDNTINDMMLACPVEGNGIAFTLDNAHGSSTQAIGDGATFWDGVPHGPFTLTEEIPAGYINPVWYCDSNAFDENGDLPGNLDWELTLAPGGVLSASINAEFGEIFACWVFNVPDGDSGSVTVVKWLCPEGFDSEADNPLTECTDLWDGVTFHLNDVAATTGDAGPGLAIWPNLPPGDYDLIETLPEGIVEGFYGACYLDDVPQLLTLGLTDPPTLMLSVDAGEHWICHVYNVPGDDNGIVIHKWRCPEGFDVNSSDQEYFDTCTEPLDGIAFQAVSDLGIAVLDTVGGQVGFGGFPAGMDVGIQEEIPEEYGNPYVICEFTDGDWSDVGAQAGYFDVHFAGNGETLECHVFNIPGGDGSITIEKWTCPPGYDLYAWGADPLADCTEATNGVQFQFGLATGLDAEAELQTTGDMLDGAIVFNDLEPDTYKAVELVPEGIERVFVLQCTGYIMGVLQPYPLETGNVLEIDLDAGEHLTCSWFNVPELEGGSITLFKYTCTTETFVSEVNCQIEEDGVTFDLLVYNEGTATWDVADTRETDGFGRIDWTDLNAGEYQVAEHGAAWCHIVFDPTDDGDHVTVLTGDHAEIHVYNCDGTPGDPGDTPTKYPNTGAGPVVTAPTSPIPGVTNGHHQRTGCFGRAGA